MIQSWCTQDVKQAKPQVHQAFPHSSFTCGVEAWE